jgi:hypothetical protein
MERERERGREIGIYRDVLPVLSEYAWVRLMSAEVAKERNG